jgi:hypothetical protein
MKMSDARVTMAAEQIDKLVTLMTHLEWSEGKGVITRFYEAARQRYGKPLSLCAAEGLAEHVSRGDMVLITTGIRLEPAYLRTGETDGFPGAAVLSRALNLGIKAMPVIVTEEAQTEIAAMLLRTAGFTVATLDNAKRFRQEGNLRSMVASVVSFPAEDEAARKMAEEMLVELEPKAIISTEMLSMNEKGVYHGAFGEAHAPDAQARVDYLFNLARDQAIFTLGIGDGGNEIGYGVIRDIVKRYKGYGAKCKCPCGAGIAAATETDVLFPASVSNWGAYGVAAVLLMIAGKSRLIHGASLETRLLEAGAEAGLIHMGSEVAPAVDTFSLGANCAIVELIREIVRKTEEFDPANWEEDGIYQIPEW